MRIPSLQAGKASVVISHYFPVIARFCAFIKSLESWQSILLLRHCEQVARLAWQSRCVAIGVFLQIACNSKGIATLVSLARNDKKSLSYLRALARSISIFVIKFAKSTLDSV